MNTIDEMRKDGYPMKIIGNGGCEATLSGRQPLSDGEYMAIYRYAGGEACHSLWEIKKIFQNSRSIRAANNRPQTVQNRKD